MAKFDKKELKKKSENISDWYTDVILKSELADYAPVKGCMVIRPYGYALWECIQGFMDRLIKEKGVKNAYFPLFIPESFLKKEKEHVEGFSPQMAVVTHAGGEELKEKLVVRPTSETVMYEMYKSWTQSWRDLPILINQWNNIVRWEKRTYLFLRTSEFLWQEGHCAHETHEQSLEYVKWALDMYEKTYNGLFALYGIKGIKSQSEKFPGAKDTYSFEMLMPDGKALQGCTSHDLGQNFAKAIDWTVQDKEGKKLFPWQNSWGFSSRSIGALVLTTGDDQGLNLPPKIAPLQVVIVGIFDSESRSGIEVYIEDISDMLKKKNLRVEVDLDTTASVGRRLNKWEMRGVPIRLEVGKKELEARKVTIFRRDNFEKCTVNLMELEARIVETLNEMQIVAFARHKKFTQDNTHKVDSYTEFKKIMDTSRGFLSAFWCEKADCEAGIKQETKATTRVRPFDAKKESGKCIRCSRQAQYRWIFAQAY
jgi:prolyl-tRNA synthetase